MNETKFVPHLERRKIETLKTEQDRSKVTVDIECKFALHTSMRQLGLLRPPVLNVETGNLLDGMEVVRLLKLDKVEEVDVWVVSVPIKLERAARFALQNHCGDWQWQEVSEALKAMRDDGVDVALTGFHSRDSGPLLLAKWQPAEIVPLHLVGEKPGQTQLL